jgi:hypothetical protein
MTRDHNYQVRLLHNNVQYTWDGIVGLTEKSLGGPENWDSAGSFPAGMSFLALPDFGQGTTDWGVIANGYNEGKIEASVFENYNTETQTGDPDTLWPLNLALLSGGEFDFSATDGNVVYFVARESDTTHSNAVVGFTLANTLPPMSATAPTEIVNTNSDGTQTFTSVPLTTYGQASWGIPYLFTSVAPQLPVPTGTPRYFSNYHANLVLSNGAVQNSVNGVTQPSYFDNGLAVGPAIVGSQTVIDPSGAQESVSSYSDPLTGIAVQRGSALPGNLLAVAHGVFDPFACMNQLTGGNSISLWDKQSGALLGVLGLENNSLTNRPVNPQKMTFDSAGNLWVIDGGMPAVDCSYPDHPLLGNNKGSGRDPIWRTYGSLIEIRFAGGGTSDNPPTVARIVPISSLSNGSVTLSNPVDVAVSPVTGHIFVADGGANQQVFEFDASTLSLYSSTGAPGGYGQNLSNTSNTCNASIGVNTLWLDYYTAGTGVARPWISVDNEDGLWIGDSTTSRIMRFARSGGSFVYSGSSQMNRWLYLVSVPRNAPTRVFAGSKGMLEYNVDYPSPDTAVEAGPMAGNAAFSAYPVRNWLPCFLQSEWENGGYPDTNSEIVSVEQFNGGTFGSVRYHSANPIVSNTHVIMELPASGILSVENGPAAQNANSMPFTKTVLFDANGSFYASSISNGPCSAPPASGWECEIITQYQTDGTDAFGFPAWGTSGYILTSASLSMIGGDPQGICGNDGCDFAPTSNKMIPFYSGVGWNWHGPITCESANGSCSPSTAPTYHLGSLPVGGNRTQWHAQLETNIEYPTLVNDTSISAPSIPPSGNVNNLGLYSTWITYYGAQNMGIGAHAIDNFIFTTVDGNWQEFSCQLYQYTDDGMMVGQFGWRSTGYYPASGSSGGAPEALKAEALAPGRCANPQMFKIVKVNGDYYLYVTDEGYRAGIQRWHIWNTASIGWLTSSTVNTLGLQVTPLTLQ